MNTVVSKKQATITSKYPLLRHLSITILIAMLITATVLVLLYRQDQLREHEAIAAEEDITILAHLTHKLSNEIHAFFIGNKTPEEISQLDSLFTFALADVKKHDILKLKLYNMSGITIYSSVKSEIGEASTQPDLLTKALHGNTEHKFDHRDIFLTLQGEMHNIDIALTYSPLILAGQQTGVIETYTDLRALYIRLHTNLFRIAIIVFTAFSMLYAALFFAVFRADRAVSRSQKITKDSEEHFKFALEGAGDGAWDWNPKSDAAFFSERWKQMLGYAEDEFPNTGTAWREHLHPDDINRVISVIQDYFTEKRTFYTVEFRMRCKDGSWKWVLARGKLLSRDRDGIPTRMIGTHTDISERKRTEQILHDSEEQARASAHQLDLQLSALNQHVVVTTTDPTGTITYANEMLSKISGYSHEELLGQNHSILNSGHHPRGFFKEMYRSISQGNIWHGEICNRNKNGNLYWVYTTIVPDIGENGKPTQYMAIRTDVTARKQAEESALAASRAKSEFLANMSHEIRTPLNGVIGMLDILQRTKLNPDQQHMTSTIQNSSLDLLNILNDILDVAKIEAGKLEIERVPTLLREVLEGAALLLYTPANEKSVELSVYVSPKLPHWIATDATRLRQVLLNLLSNSVKFTESTAACTGRITLRAEPTLLTNGVPAMQLCVSDNGIGMNQETLNKLFLPFTQADVSTSRKFGGTGLGLSICRRLVELMDGQISVRSSLGEHTEFTIILPLEEVPPSRRDDPAPDLTGISVLILTADVMKGEDLSSYCHSAGAEVTVVADTAAARLRLQQSSPLPLVILCDVNIATKDIMVLKDDVSVVQLVRREQSTSIDNVISIPARPLFYRNLLNGLAVASGRMKRRDVITQSEPPWQARLRTATVNEALADNQLILLAEDNETNREVMREQLHLLGYAVEIAEDGMVALDMWRSGRYALLLTDCHMPLMDGFELTTAIRREETSETHLPIIAVTANAMRGEAQRCIAHGMDDYLSKPLRLDKLQTMLAQRLPLRQIGASNTNTNTSTTILIVEDDALVAESVKLKLIESHYNVAAIVDYGEQAIEQAQALVPDLVLMDIILAGKMDGIEAAQKIRERFDIPVLFLTSYANDEFFQRAQVTHPYGYLIKPSTPREIQLAIEIALFRHKSERSTRVTLELAVAKRTDELEQSRHNTDEILERVSDAFLSLDSNWRYTYVNAKAGKLFGRDPETLIGKNIWTEFPDAVAQPFYHAYHKALDEQTPLNLETYYPHNKKWYESRIYPYKDGLSIFFREIVTFKPTANPAGSQHQQKIEMPIQSTTLAVWDVTTLTRMVGDNPAMHRRLLQKFLLNTQQQITVLTSNVTMTDLKTAKNVAHALKSSARTVGALQLGELCEKMEKTEKTGTAFNELFVCIKKAFDAVAEKIQQKLNETDH